MQRGVFHYDDYGSIDREGKTLRDVVFAAGAAAREAAARYGEEKLSTRLLAVMPVKMKNWLVCLSLNSYTALCR